MRTMVVADGGFWVDVGAVNANGKQLEKQQKGGEQDGKMCIRIFADPKEKHLGRQQQETGSR